MGGTGERNKQNSRSVQDDYGRVTVICRTGQNEMKIGGGKRKR